MIYYQVEYKQIARDGAEWVDVGPRITKYSDALDWLTEERDADPEYSYRIVQWRMVATVLTTVAGKHEVEVTEQ